MCDVEDEYKVWQRKYGNRPRSKIVPAVEVRQGGDGVVREYCGRCGWGWPIGAKAAYQKHQPNCPNAKAKR